MFLWLNSQEYFPRKIITDYSNLTDIDQVYRKMNFPEKLIRRIFCLLNIDWIPTNWLGPWFRHANEYHLLIIHANLFTPMVVKKVNSHFPALRIVVWYWNPVCKSVLPQKFNQLNCELWTFDKKDAEKFGMRYNSQYYLASFFKEKENPDFDIVFIGEDKGRLKKLNSLTDYFHSVGLTTCIYLCNTEKKLHSGLKKRISYEKILEIYTNAVCILDITAPGQTGLSLRPLEGLFFEKKVISDNPIIKEESLYHPDNYFLLDSQGINKEAFLSFFHTEFNKEHALQNQQDYSFENWLQTIIKGGENL